VHPSASALAELDFVGRELQKLLASGAVRRATAQELETGVCLGDLVVARSKGELYGQRGQGWVDEPPVGSPAERIAARDGTLAKRRLCYDVSRSLAPCEDLVGAEYNVVDWIELVDAMRAHGPYTAREDFKAGFITCVFARTTNAIGRFVRPSTGRFMFGSDCRSACAVPLGCLVWWRGRCCWRYVRPAIVYSCRSMI
jgi:hypothetical protein